MKLLIFLVVMGGCASQEKAQKNSPVVPADDQVKAVEPNPVVQQNSAANASDIGRLIRRGDLAKAQELTTVRLLQDSKDQEAWFFKGNIHLAQRKFRLALLAYDQALELGDRSTGLLLNRGLAYLGLGQVFEAQLELRAANKLTPNHREAALTYSQVLVRFENYQAARQVLEPIRQRSLDDPMFLSIFGASLVGSAAWEPAVAPLERLINKFENRANAADRFNYLVALIRSGKDADAVNLLDQYSSQGFLTSAMVQEIQLLRGGVE